MASMKFSPWRASALMLFAGACASADPVVQPVRAGDIGPGKPASPVYELGDFLGAPAARIDALLGAPALVRREGAGEFRRYSLRDCNLIVILYPDEAGASGASHIEATAKQSAGEKPDLDACLAAGQ